jgi:hypothetical protein
LLAAPGCSSDGSKPGTDAQLPEVLDTLVDTSPGDTAQDTLEVLADLRDTLDLPDGATDTGPLPDTDAAPDLETSSDVPKDLGQDLEVHLGETTDPDAGTLDGATDTGSPDTSPDTLQDTVQAPDTTELPSDEYYSSAELAIRILGPDSSGWGAVVGGVITVSGVVMGQPDRIEWEIDSDEDQGGFSTGLPFFVTSKIVLTPGDNLVTVYAKKGQKLVQDSIRITYNPAFQFGSRLEVRPGGIFVGEKNELVFTMAGGIYNNYDPLTLKLCESTPSGICVSDVHQMVDDGQVEVSGDEVGDDGVYTWKRSYQFTEAGRLCFRAHVLVAAGYQHYTAYSPVTCVDVVDHLTKASCEAIRGLHQQANNLYGTTLVASGSEAQAQAAVVSLLKGQSQVAEVGTVVAGQGVWVRYKSGILGALNFRRAGTRGGYEEDPEPPPTEPGSILAALGETEVKIGSKEALILSPFRSEFGVQDEGNFVYNLLKKSECPPYVISGPYNDYGAGLELFQNLRRYGIVALVTHGDAYFRQLPDEYKEDYGWHHLGSQEVLWTGEALDCNRLLQEQAFCGDEGPCPMGTNCVLTQSSGQGNSKVRGVCVDNKQIDLMRGRLVLGVDRYGVLPAHIARHRGEGYPQSLIYLGACRSLWNGTLAMELFAAGATTIAGFSGVVTSKFAYAMGTRLFSGMIEETKLSGAAMPVVDEDEDNPGSRFRLFGGRTTNIFDSEILNQSWERGRLVGWQSSGDGRVVSKLGITTPVEGKFMSLVSTGMGYTTQTGAIEQTFCIPADKSILSFYWKFYSEEFKEWCDSEYQDSFQASLESKFGLLKPVDVWINSLCAPEDCKKSACGAMYTGLEHADVAFDVGGVWSNAWQKAELNVVGVAGRGPVKLRFSTADTGDSIYDTAVLIDAVKLR